jgi:mono/diheme cytochrome c family protein
MAAVAPPLAGNSYVTGDPKAVIHTLLYGLQGPIQVNGKPWTGGQMPAWKGQLSNADIANVITYIRSSWGNSAPPVTEKQVSQVKQ